MRQHDTDIASHIEDLHNAASDLLESTCTGIRKGLYSFPFVASVFYIIVAMVYLFLGFFILSPGVRTWIELLISYVPSISIQSILNSFMLILLGAVFFVWVNTVIFPGLQISLRFRRYRFWIMLAQVFFLTPLWFTILYFFFIDQASFNISFFGVWYRNQLLILLIAFLITWLVLALTSAFIPKLLLLILPSTDIHRSISGIPAHEQLITAMLPKTRSILKNCNPLVIQDIQTIENARVVHINTHLQIFALFAAVLGLIGSVGVINAAQIQSILNGVNITVAQMLNEAPSLLTQEDVQILAGTIVVISIVASYFYTQSVFKASRMLDIIDVTSTIILREREREEKIQAPPMQVHQIPPPPSQSLRHLSIYTLVVLILVYLDRVVSKVSKRKPKQ